jgi:hypothetical protein
MRLARGVYPVFMTGRRKSAIHEGDFPGMFESRYFEDTIISQTAIAWRFCATIAPDLDSRSGGNDNQALVVEWSHLGNKPLE